MLDGELWGDPEYNSNLVATIHKLRKKPLKDFSIEDLRICIGQQFFLQHLIPLAIQELERNPFAQGDFYPGDLLQNVINVNDEYWLNHSGQKSYLMKIINTALCSLNTLDESDKKYLIKILEKGKIKFNSIP